MIRKNGSSMMGLFYAVVLLLFILILVSIGSLIKVLVGVTA